MKNDREEMPYTKMFGRIRKTGLVLTALGVAGGIYGSMMVSKINEQYLPFERYDKIVNQIAKINGSLRDYNVSDFVSSDAKSALEEKIKQVRILNEERERVIQLPDFQEQDDKRSSYKGLTFLSWFLGTFAVMGIMRKEL